VHDNIANAIDLARSSSSNNLFGIDKSDDSVKEDDDGHNDNKGNKLDNSDNDHGNDEYGSQDNDNDGYNAYNNIAFEFNFEHGRSCEYDNDHDNHIGLSHVMHDPRDTGQTRSYGNVQIPHSRISLPEFPWRPQILFQGPRLGDQKLPHLRRLPRSRCGLRHAGTHHNRSTTDIKSPLLGRVLGRI